jgi:hypothetical protein
MKSDYLTPDEVLEIKSEIVDVHNDFCPDGRRPSRADEKAMIKRQAKVISGRLAYITKRSIVKAWKIYRKGACREFLDDPEDMWSMALSPCFLVWAIDWVVRNRGVKADDGERLEGHAAKTYLRKLDIERRQEAGEFTNPTPLAGRVSFYERDLYIESIAKTGELT